MDLLDDEYCNQRLLTHAEEIIHQRLSKYGASQEPPRDDGIMPPTDDDYKFFEKVYIYSHLDFGFQHALHCFLAIIALVEMVVIQCLVFNPLTAK